MRSVTILAITLAIVLGCARADRDNNNGNGNGRPSPPATTAAPPPAHYGPIKASFTFELSGNFSGQPLRYGESQISLSSHIDLAKLRAFSLSEIKGEYGIEFYPSAYDGFSASSSPFPFLYSIAPITVGTPGISYSVTSLYDGTGEFSNDYDRETDRPEALLTEYAVTVNGTTLAALKCQGIKPTYGGRYGTVITQFVAEGDVIAAGAYNFTQIRYDDRDNRNQGRGRAGDRDCSKRVVTRVHSFLSKIPGPSIRFAKNPGDVPSGTFNIEAFKAWSPVWGHGEQLLSVTMGPLVNGTQAITYRNHADFPGTYGVPALPVLGQRISF